MAKAKKNMASDIEKEMVCFGKKGKTPKGKAQMASMPTKKQMEPGRYGSVHFE